MALSCIRMAAWVLLFLVTAQRSFAAGEWVGHECGPGCGCSSTPYHQMAPGYNLFWHNPCGVADSCDWKCYHATAAAPTWYVGAELLALMRDQQDEFTYATNVAGLTLSTTQFDDEFDAGVRGVLGAAIGDSYRLETVYFGTHEWSDSVIGMSGGASASISFYSELDSVELNLRRRRDAYRPLRRQAEVAFLLGARYMSLDEQFTNGYTVATTNELIGPQIGMSAQFLGFWRSWVDFEIKGAICQNEVTQSTAGGTVDGVAVAAGAVSENRTAFVGEMSLNYNYHATESLTLRAGYNAYWLTGVGLAAQNYDGNLAVGQPVVNHSGEVIYHGFNLGFVYAR